MQLSARCPWALTCLTDPGDQGPGRRGTRMNFCDSGCRCPVWALGETGMFLVLPMTFPGGLTGFSGEPSFFEQNEPTANLSWSFVCCQVKGSERKCQLLLSLKHYLIHFEIYKPQKLGDKDFLSPLTCLEPIIPATKIALLILDEAGQGCPAGGRAWHFSFHAGRCSF